MNGEQLLELFDRVSEAPGAVPKLRSLLFDLAVLGKLVTQDDADEPASVLLKRMGQPTRYPRIPSPQPLPNNWAWTSLAEIGRVNPRNQADDSTTVGFVPMTLISSEYRIRPKFETRAWHQVKSGYTHFANGDVALAKITPCFENSKTAVFTDLPNGIGAGTTELHVLRPIAAIAEYVEIYLKSPLFMESGKSKMTGTAGQKRLPTDYFASAPFPLPPSAEQDRIVQKVNELMSLCDQLEAAQTERETRRDRLNAAALHNLTTPTDPNTFRTHATFYINHLPRLTVRPDQIPSLRQTILDLAVQGKLVPQDPNDESFSTLETTDSEATVAEFGFATEIPANWKWATLGDFVTSADSGWSPKAESFPRSGTNWGVIKVSAVSWDRFLDEENKQLLPGIEPPSKAQIHAGDFLISRANTSQLIAKSVIVDHEPECLILSDKIVRLQISSSCDQRYLNLLNNHSRLARVYYAARASGTSLSMKNVSRDVIYRLPIALPPVREQHRIVIKVDQLISLCDQLERQLTEGQTENRQLLEVLLQEGLLSTKSASS